MERRLAVGREELGVGGQCHPEAAPAVDALVPLTLWHPPSDSAGLGNDYGHGGVWAKLRGGTALAVCSLCLEPTRPQRPCPRRSKAFLPCPKGMSPAAPPGALFAPAQWVPGAPLRGACLARGSCHLASPGLHPDP